MTNYGFQNLEKISRQMTGAALAAGIAGTSAGLEELKNDLKDAAPVGKGKISPRGRVTPGGRTKGSIGLAYPRVRAGGIGPYSGFADVEVTVVMAPQGIYHNDGVGPQRIAPKLGKAMVFMSGSKWFSIGPSLRGGFTQRRNPGMSQTGFGTQFVQASAVTRGPQAGSGWINGVTLRPNIAIAYRAWGRIVGRPTRRPTASDIPKKAFTYQQTPGAWGSGYKASGDQKLRNNWRAAANRAGTVWGNQVRAALAKFRI